MSWQKYPKKETSEIVEGIGLPLSKKELRRRSLAAQYALRAFAEYLEVPADRQAVLAMVRAVIDHDKKAMKYLPGPQNEDIQTFPHDYIYPALAGKRVPARGQVRRGLERLSDDMEARFNRQFVRHLQPEEAYRYLEALAFVLETLQEPPELGLMDTQLSQDYQPDPLMPRPTENVDEFVEALRKAFGD